MRHKIATLTAVILSKSSVAQIVELDVIGTCGFMSECGIVAVNTMIVKKTQARDSKIVQVLWKSKRRRAAFEE